MGDNPVNGPDISVVNCFTRDRTSTIFAADLTMYAKEIQVFQVVHDKICARALVMHGGSGPVAIDMVDVSEPGKIRRIRSRRGPRNPG